MFNKKYKKIWFTILLALLVLSFIFFVSAYNNGSEVVSTPHVQWVSHTEYWSSSGPGSGDVVSTIVRITDYKGDPFSVDSCAVTMYYPNKSVYVSNGPLSSSPASGNWYRTDTAPDAEGTYEQEVTCTYGASKTIKTSQSFHVNPALNFLKNIDEDILATNANLTSVNLTIVGKVEDAQADINTNIDSAETNLTNLMNDINSSLSNQLSDAEGSLSTQLTNVKVVIQANIADMNESIQTRIDLAETNLDGLIKSINTNLSNQLTSAEANLDAKLTDVNASLTGVMNDIKATLLTRIDTAETNLNELLNQVDSDLSSQLTGATGNLSSQIKDMNISLFAELGSTRTTIQTDLSNINASISSLVKTLNDDIKAYLVTYLPDINDTANNIYVDTQWLVTNAMNQDDNAVIIGRFNAVDANLSVIEDFCSNTQTSGSLLCTDVAYIKTTLDTTRAEQTSYFNTLNETTVNTWDLLSGDITTNINTLLTNVGIIKSQTTQINETLESWKAEEEARVYIQPIA